MFSSQEKLFQHQNGLSALNQPKIVKTLFILDKNLRYSFDVNQNITIRLLKNMIDAAANLNRAHLRIFHEGKEYTSYDDSTLEILFPDLNLVIFSLTVSFDSFEVYNNLISLKLNKADFFYENNGSIYPALITSDYYEMNNIVLYIFLNILIFIVLLVVKVFVLNVLSQMNIKIMIIKKNMITYNQAKN